MSEYHTDNTCQQTLEPIQTTKRQFLGNTCVLNHRCSTYQVTNNGADILASWLDNNILFRYTMEMDTTQYAAITPATYVMEFLPDIVKEIFRASL